MPTGGCYFDNSASPICVPADVLANNCAMNYADGNISLVFVHISMDSSAFVAFVDRAMFQYPIRHLIKDLVKTWSCEMARLNYHITLKFDRHIAAVLQMCLSNLRVIEHSKYKSYCFETLRDLTLRHLIRYWNRTERMLFKMVLWDFHIWQHDRAPAC